MDRKILMEQWKDVQRSVVRGRDLIARQQTVITQLDRRGEDTAAERAVLKLLQDVQTLVEGHEDMVVAALESVPK